MNALALPMVAIGDLVEPVRTWNPATKPSDTFDYVDLSAVSQAEKRIAASTPTRGADAPSRARQLIREGDVLVSTVRPNLNGVAPVTEDFDGATASTGFCVLRPRAQKLANAYLMHWVRSPQFIDLMVRQATGASYPAVSDKIIKASAVPLPPLDEQRRIAAILDKADALRRKRKRALELLDGLGSSIFFEMFGDARGDAHGYPVTDVGSICDLINGAAFKPSDWTDEGSPIIRIQNLNDPQKPFNRTTRKLADRLWIVPGDYLFSWSGTPGTSFGCFKWSGPEGWLNQHIFKVLCAPNVLGTFFQYQLNARMDELIAKAHGGVGLQHVTKTMINEMPFICPSLQLQHEFVDRIAKIRLLSSRFLASDASSDGFFDTLQNRAFSGQL